MDQGDTIGAPGRLYVVDCHRALQGVADGMHAWLLERCPRTTDYPAEALAGRLMQKVLSIIYRPYMKLCIAMGRPPANALPSDGESLWLDGLSLDIGSGRVRCGAAFWMRSMVAFILYWGYVLGLALRALAAGSSGTSAVLLHGLAIDTLAAGGDDGKLLAYCRDGDIRELNRAERIFVQSHGRVPATKPYFASYGRYPMSDQFSVCRLGAAAFFGFLIDHLRTGISFMWLAVRFPPAIVLGRDFAFDAAAASLNRRRLIDAVLLTGTNYAEQMLWMTDLPKRAFRTCMIFYSVNSFPFRYRERPETAVNPLLGCMRVDQFYVWTPGHIDQVRSWGLSTPCTVVGPILFQLPAPPGPVDDDVFCLAVFDVTPFSPDAAIKLGMVNPYYTAGTVQRFLEDVVAAGRQAAIKRGMRLRIVLKPKRRYESIHDSEYIALVRSAALDEGQFVLAPTDANLHSLIAGARFVVSLPYSSPVYVGAAIGVPGIYHDSSGELLPSHEASPLIEFTSDRDQLLAALLRR